MCPKSAPRALPLVKLFAAEISIEKIRPYDEMPAYIESQEPEIAKVTQYYKLGAAGFDPAFPKK